jgi:hypothetical protein
MSCSEEGENGVYTTQNTGELCLVSVIRFDPSYAGNIFTGSRILVSDQQLSPFTVRGKFHHFSHLSGEN